MHSTEAPDVWVGLGADLEIKIPDLEDIRPTVYLRHFVEGQAYRFVFFGEKTSLGDVLTPICNRYSADLYLLSGEISDTQLYTMARTGAEDGRPMVVFVLADFDPSGNQMAASIGRKLQAFRDLHFPGLEFELHAIALNEDQVRDLALPLTPLKDTERRADRWRAEFSLEQTEIDALATLRPDALRRIVEDAIAPFYDSTLIRRTATVCNGWEEWAQAVLDERLDDELIRNLHAQAEAKIETVRAEIEAINAQLRSATATLGLDLPAPVRPEPELSEGTKGKPIISTAWSRIAQTRGLKARKSYGNGAAAEAAE